MIKWTRIEAGEYESEDKRFRIMKDYDRIYGEHWTLYDQTIDDWYKMQYHEATLKECKLKAEVL